MNQDREPHVLTFQERQRLFNQLQKPEPPIPQRSPRLPPRKSIVSTNGTPSSNCYSTTPPLPPRKGSVCVDNEALESCDNKVTIGREMSSRRSELRRAIKVKRTPTGARKRNSTVVKRTPSPNRRRSPDSRTSSPDSRTSSPDFRISSPDSRSPSPSFASNRSGTIKRVESGTKASVSNSMPIPDLPPIRNSYDERLKLQPGQTLAQGEKTYHYARHTGKSISLSRKDSGESRPAPPTPSNLTPYTIPRSPRNIPAPTSSTNTRLNSNCYSFHPPPVNLKTHPKSQDISPSSSTSSSPRNSYIPPRYSTSIPPPIPSSLPPPLNSSRDTPGGGVTLSTLKVEDDRLGDPDEVSDYYEDDDDIYGQITSTVLDDIDDVGGSDFMIFQKPAAPVQPTKPTGTGFREFWHERKEVQESGILDGEQISKKERSRQEAMYEILTSEQTFRKSMDILEKQFISDNLFGCYFEDNDDVGGVEVIFANIRDIISCSNRLVDELKTLYKNKAMIESITSLLKNFVDHQFSVYIEYCAHQSLQQELLATKRKEESEFNMYLEEKERALMGQNLQSYLVMPMQRICRMPLLISAVLSKTDEESPDHQELAVVYKDVSAIVEKCNEEARKSDIRRAMKELQERCDFDKIKKNLTSFTDKPERLIIKEGEVFKLKFKGSRIQAQKIYLWLFTDCLVIGAKMDTKDENRRFSLVPELQKVMTLLEHSPRQLLKIAAHFQLPRGIASKKSNPSENIFHLQLLGSGPSGKHIIQCSSATEKERWLEVLKPTTKDPENEDETIYAEWDIPLVRTKFDYKMINNDDLELYEGEVCKVLKKYRDGWCYGVRERDGKKGWFPFSYMEEIHTEHTKYREMRKKYEMMENLINHPQATEILSTMNR